MADGADVAIVGGGPAGAALAIRLATAGVRVLLFERFAEPRWRACGVFSSPLTRRRLVELGVGATDVAQLARPISALNLQTTRGASCRIEYEHGYACGFDRVRLDAKLLHGARAAGAEVRMATVVRSIELPERQMDPVRLHVSPTDVKRRGDRRVIEARVVVGADGTGSVVGGAARITEWEFRRRPKAGVTFHRFDPAAAPEGDPMEGRFAFGKGWYVGVAPVPGERVNVGMVVPGAWLADRSEAISARLLTAFPPPRDPWISAPSTDAHVVAGMLEHRPTRVAGDRFVLIGDAAGFIDPLTGEGIHRALVSAEIAADAIRRWLRGDRNALRDYDRHLRSRFLSKDVVSWVLQAFFARPRLFDYALRRLASRTGLRRELTLVLTDQLPATRALDPRYLFRLLAP